MYPYHFEELAHKLLMCLRYFKKHRNDRLPQAIANLPPLGKPVDHVALQPKEVQEWTEEKLVSLIFQYGICQGYGIAQDHLKIEKSLVATLSSFIFPVGEVIVAKMDVDLPSKGIACKRGDEVAVDNINQYYYNQPHIRLYWRRKSST